MFICVLLGICHLVIGMRQLHHSVLSGTPAIFLVVVFQYVTVCWLVSGPDDLRPSIRSASPHGYHMQSNWQQLRKGNLGARVLCLYFSGATCISPLCVACDGAMLSTVPGHLPYTHTSHSTLLSAKPVVTSIVFDRRCGSHSTSSGLCSGYHSVFPCRTTWIAKWPVCPLKWILSID